MADVLNFDYTENDQNFTPAMNASLDFIVSSIEDQSPFFYFGQ